MPDGQPWPRISIVTPSYNQGQFIEETIRSVLLQGYPDLEYIIVDGASTDCSVDIIRRYEPWLAHWESEPDRGQSHAINKGLDRTTGSVAAYLNSDDLYLPGALHHVGECALKSDFDVLVGRRLPQFRAKSFLVRYVWWQHVVFGSFSPVHVFSGRRGADIPQECVFWNFDRFRGLRLDESYHFCMDQWLWACLFSDARVTYTSKQLGFFRYHQESKSARLAEVNRAEWTRWLDQFSQYAGGISPQQRRRILIRHFLHSVPAFFVRAFRSYVYSYHHPRYLPNASLGSEA